MKIERKAKGAQLKVLSPRQLQETLKEEEEYEPLISIKEIFYSILAPSNSIHFNLPQISRFYKFSNFPSFLSSINIPRPSNPTLILNRVSTKYSVFSKNRGGEK